MNKRNKLKRLNRTSEHREAMLNNMVTSLFKHERITSTLVKAKVARSLAEKLISRAKKNIGEEKTEIALHNKREVMKRIKDRNVVVKLFDEIAGRYSERIGGYTRVIKLVNRPSDNSAMAILELVDRKVAEELKEDKKDKKAKSTPKEKEAKDKSIKEKKTAKK